MPATHYLCGFSRGKAGPDGFVPADGGCRPEPDQLAWEMAEVLRHAFGINMEAFVPALGEIGLADPERLPSPARCLEVVSADRVLEALAESGGMLGLSLYPHHLANGSDCSLEAFCEMVARSAELMGVECIGIGSDLCQDQPDSVVRWMRNGTWTRSPDYGEGSAQQAGFPPQPEWFRGNRDFVGIAQGLRAVGFDEAEVGKIMGGNWLAFFERSFGPLGGPLGGPQGEAA